MNKAEFLKELERHLGAMPKAERQDVIYDYEEHIRTATENGMSEVDAVASLGAPKTIAKELLADYHVQQAEKKGTVQSVFRASLAIISLGFFNLVVVAGPLAGLIAVFVALFAAGFALTVAPFVGIAGILLGVYPTGVDVWWMAVFAYVAMEGIGILVMVATYKIGMWFAKLCLKYLRFNLKIVQGAE